MAKKSNGFVIYRGPSELDGKPIVVIATGFRDKSENIKTGALLQTWILREDISPLEAVHSGEDVSICGDCPHKGILVKQADGSTRNRLRICYVLEFKAPLSIWRAYKRGSYTDATGFQAKDLAAVFRGRKVRLGAYGDPAAVPQRVWALVTLEAAKWAGYTHQWRKIPAGSILQKVTMASVDTETDAIHAQALGWRTFRVGSDDTPGEIICPASDEGGKRTTCERCTLCQGAYRQAKNIRIAPHGSRIATARKHQGKVLVLAG
jgi:hypothetical protein